MAIDKVRFVTIAGNIDLDITPEFNLDQQITMIRGAGYMMGPNVYLPLTSILAVFTYDSEIAKQIGPTFDLNAVPKGKMN